jgi:hypothetical protein
MSGLTIFQSSTSWRYDVLTTAFGRLTQTFRSGSGRERYDLRNCHELGSNHAGTSRSHAPSPGCTASIRARRNPNTQRTRIARREDSRVIKHRRIGTDNISPSETSKDSWPRHASTHAERRRTTEPCFTMADDDYNCFMHPSNNFNPVSLPETATEAFYYTPFSESTRTTRFYLYAGNHRQRHEYRTTDRQCCLYVRLTIDQISTLEAAGRFKGCNTSVYMPCQQFSRATRNVTLLEIDMKDNVQAS